MPTRPHDSVWHTRRQPTRHCVGEHWTAHTCGRKAAGPNESFGTIALPAHIAATTRTSILSALQAFSILGPTSLVKKKSPNFSRDKKSLWWHPTTLKVGKTMWISRKVATTFTTCHHVTFYKNGRVYQNILNCHGRKNMFRKMTWTKMFYRSSSIHYKFHDA